MQALDNATLGTQDFSFLSRISLDLGTDDVLLSFFVDQGLLSARVLAENCTAFATQLEALTGAQGAPAPAADGGEFDLSGAALLRRFASSCLDALAAQEPGVPQLEHKLFCQLADPKVRASSAVLHPCGHGEASTSWGCGHAPRGARAGRPLRRRARGAGARSPECEGCV